MKTKSIESLLAEHPFFKNLPAKYVKLIAGCGSNVHFKAGEVIFLESEEANQFYVVRHGKIAVQMFAAQRGSITIQTIQDGEILGWSWLIPPYHWRFDARAIDATSAIALDGKCLRKKCEKDRELGYELLKRFAYVITQRLELTRLQLLDMYGVHTQKDKTHV